MGVSSVWPDFRRGGKRHGGCSEGTIEQLTVVKPISFPKPREALRLVAPSCPLNKGQKSIYFRNPTHFVLQNEDAAAATFRAGSRHESWTLNYQPAPLKATATLHIRKDRTIMKTIFTLIISITLGANSVLAADAVTEPVHLLGGKSLDSFYTWIRGRGRDKDPSGVFSFKDGILQIRPMESGYLS